MSNNTIPIKKPELIPIDTIKPFTRFCCSIGMIPSSYKASMSYEEQLMWLCHFLEDILLPTVNTNTESFLEIEALFEELSNYVEHYFDNLNVQEEINNKLDEMATDGTLEAVLAGAVNLYYDTINDLIQANLPAGQIVNIKGYYNVNDGGSATYIISNTEPSSSSFYVQLDNNNYACFIPTKKVYDSIAFGDNTSTEDTKNFLQKICNISSYHQIKIKLRSKTYNVSGEITVNSNCCLNLNNATIKLMDNSDTYIFGNMSNYSQSSELNNISIVNGIIDGNSDFNYSDNLSGMALILYYAKNVVLKNLTIKNCERNAFNLFEISNSIIENINFINFGTHSSSFISGGNYAINLENRNSQSNKGSNVLIKDIKCDGLASHFIHVYNYSYVDLKNYESKNSTNNPNLNSVVLTFTNSAYCNFENIVVDNCYKNICEINQGSKNIIIKNMTATSNSNGIVFGPNTDLTSINSMNSFENCTINANNYAITYNYSDNNYFKNCVITGGLGGGENNASNLFFNNCKCSLDETKLYLQRCSTFIDTIINDFSIKYFNKNTLIDFQINFDLTASEEKEITLSLLKSMASYSSKLWLDIFSYNPSSPNQRYYANYTYLISSITSDLGVLSDIINSGGSNYRKITPSVVLRNSIHIVSASDTALKCYMHFHN